MAKQKQKSKSKAKTKAGKLRARKRATSKRKILSRLAESTTQTEPEFRKYKPSASRTRKTEDRSRGYRNIRISFASQSKSNQFLPLDAALLLAKQLFERTKEKVFKYGPRPPIYRVRASIEGEGIVIDDQGEILDTLPIWREAFERGEGQSLKEAVATAINVALEELNQPSVQTGSERVDYYLIRKTGIYVEKQLPLPSPKSKKRKTKNRSRRS